ncbi:unnamed protein product, partial [Iphiclides podalirius]
MQKHIVAIPPNNFTSATYHRWRTIGGRILFIMHEGPYGEEELVVWSGKLLPNSFNLSCATCVAVRVTRRVTAGCSNAAIHVGVLVIRLLRAGLHREHRDHIRKRLVTF